jgi:tRNA A-37 threonylcarbamoyl transferase component Bud32
MMLPLLSAAQLAEAGWNPPAPFALALPDGGQIEFCRVLRWLPGQRVSGEARWGGKAVFAKLFIGERAARHAAREQQGIQALQTQGLPTPACLTTLSLPGLGLLLLSEFLPDAQTLESSLADVQSLLPAFALLGRLHAAELVHDDLHPGNFLQQGERLWLIDGDGIRPTAAAAQHLANLALLLSQLPLALEVHWDSLLQAYGLPVASNVLPQLVDDWRQRRLQRFLEKTVRNCTKFAVDRNKSRFSVVLRTAQEALGGLLADPDALLAQGRFFKDGGTCSVAALDVGEIPTVVKRYNLRNWRHALSRAWRPSRAWHSWREARRLAFYGIATPTPLLMIEERCGPLRGRAFLVTGFCPGPSLFEVLSAEQVPAADLATALTRLFADLYRLRITHGDLKAHNLLWHDGQVVLIDLDGTTQPRSSGSFRRAWRRDRMRFLRNWPAGSVLHDWLEARLPPA